MGLEAASWIDDLTTTNPAVGDQVSVGDDHIRLLKAVLKATFPAAGKAFRFPSAEAKSVDYIAVVGDQNKLFSVSASVAARTITLPTLVAGDAGWAIQVQKSDSSANAVIVAPASGTIQEVASVSVTSQYAATLIFWTGTAWLAFALPAMTAAPYVAGGTDVAVADGGTGASTAADARTNLGLGTADNPQFNAVNVGAATDTTLSRASAGNLAVEGNLLYRASGTDVPVADGGTGSSTAAGARTNLGAAPTASPTFTGTVTLPGTDMPTGALEFGTFSDTGASAGQTIGGTGHMPTRRSSHSVTTNVGHSQFYNPNGLVGSIITNGTGTSYNTTSDGDLKDEVKDIPAAAAIANLKSGRPVEFEFKTNPGVKHVGFIAQEMADIVPDAVTPPLNEGEPWMMDHSRLVPVLWAAVQALTARLEILEAR